MPYTKPIRTIRSIYPGKKGKASRIKIDQPDYRDVSLTKRDVVRWDEINLEPDWFTLHKRGVRRIRVGEDPLEARAVSHDSVRGTLPERIVYKYLVAILRMTDGIEFTFQSSLEGGRIELGGMVVDFLFPQYKYILQVQGPTHNTFLRKAKDQEQASILEAYGYKVYELVDDIIYDEYMFEEWMRRFFGFPEARGGGGGSHGSFESDQSTSVYDRLFEAVIDLQSSIYEMFEV